MSGSDAIAIIELTSIARGFTALDTMIKRAPVRVLDSGVISPGKFLIVVTGDVASVDEAFIAGLAHGDDRVIDRLFLPQVHRQIVPVMDGAAALPPIDAVGIVEAWSAASTIHAADVAAKCAAVDLLTIKFSRHLGGKGYFTLTGPQEDVEAALGAASEVLTAAGLLVACEQINRPHEEFIEEILPRGGSELRWRS